MTNVRKGILILLPIISTLLVSCWDEFNERTYYSANVVSFGFDQHDVAPGIEDYVFYIDNFNGDSTLGTSGTIYNPDSLPFGTKVNRLFPKLDVQSTNGKFYFDDVIWDEKTDSVDFTNTVVLKNTSYDERYTKKYGVNVSVHKVNPDSMVLETLPASLPAPTGINKLISAGSVFLDYSLDAVKGFNVYASSDTMRSWSQKSVTGLVSDMNLSSVCLINDKSFALSASHSLFSSDNGWDWIGRSPVDKNGNPVTLIQLYGSIAFPNDTIPDILSGLLIGASGDTCFARSSDGLIWEKGQPVKLDFPSSGFGLVRSESVTKSQSLTIAGGVTFKGDLAKTVWSTDNGLDWKLINNSRIAGTAPLQSNNVLLFHYQNYLVCMGGTDLSGNYISTIRVSPDNGVTWMNAPTLWTMYKLSSGIKGAGVCVQRIEDTVNDKDREFLYMVGGVRPTGDSNKVWKAYLYNMIFARR